MKTFSIQAKYMAFLMALWPPFWFTGIHYSFIRDDYRQIKVSMKLRWYNKNMLGIQYGGNLFSMTDPCYIMMLISNLGDKYKVIDQSASIDYIKPGLGTVYAECRLEQDDIDDIVEMTANGDKYLKKFTIELTDDDGDTVARIGRVLYIRKKQEAFS